MGQVRRCWENVAKNSAESNAPQGTVEVEFAVGQGGAAQDVRVSKNETGSDQLATCVVALVQSWQFPRHTGDPVVFVWPFLFRTAK
jgi:TonB family protein